jgi:hypothetical protein
MMRTYLNMKNLFFALIERTSGVGLRSLNKIRVGRASYRAER